MKRTRIDFAPPGLRRTLFRAPPTLIYAVPGVLALCIPALFMTQRYFEQQEEVRDLQAALAARSAPAPVAAPPAPKVAVAPAQAGAVNAAILQLNLPWRDVAAALGEATPNTIALLALEPDAKRRTVRISAEARSSDEMLAYITRLQAEEWFSSVVLLRHEVMEQDPNRPLRFQVSVQWEAS
ncbi:PilN domain-containing protein [Massilia arenae]|uniref:PilN domain-containing protein n=1 Tax=Massilia arenae TaxID=2603288 RepID=A0A5C7G246_9BURK|nr:PilN domain-containing protein [Massilia arenae]TXG00065.1 PilN domain-containing protein [Massilia arenae]